MKMENTLNKDESFRDHIATINEQGKRNWIYAKKPFGKFYNRRSLVSVIFLILLFTGPFLKLHGHPLMLFNIIERKFIIFGIAFWPQDFILFLLALLTFIVFIILFTALFGRLFCGWVCPQTIFMEMVFRKIEYWIEGDSMQQKALDKRSWDFYKRKKRGTKHLVFFLISFLIANTFLSYIIGVDEMKKLITEGPGEHLGGFFSLIVFTGVFYGVYARFREQVCIVVCPYGRLQGVLLDENSVIVGYDYKRGEPRGKVSQQTEKKFGDCIDCHACVHVCPTGIDIRNGTQLECVNCTACIDACDDIMDKVKKPHGLIRYTSENAIAKGEKFKVTTRIIGYSIVLFILASVLGTLLITRSDTETTVLRTPGMLYQKQPNDKISNLYAIKIVNKTFRNLPVTVRISEPANAELKWIGNGISKIKEDELGEGQFFVILPKSDIKSIKTPIKVEVISKGKVIERTQTSFIGPN